MHPLTHTIMTNILSLLLTILACFTATGCNSDNTTLPDPTPTEKKVVYDLPEGWEWSGGNVMPTGDAIYWIDKDNRPKETERDGSGFYKIGDFTFQEGDEAMVEAKAMDYLSQHEECDELPCSWNNEYVDYTDESTLEAKTIGNEKVYVIANHTEQEGYQFWGHHIMFEKDGIVYDGAIYGNKFDTFTEPLETILDSIRVE